MLHGEDIKMTNRMQTEKIHHNDHIWQIGNLILAWTLLPIFNANLIDGMGYSILDVLLFVEYSNGLIKLGNIH
jgi:hypothetical protein